MKTPTREQRRLENLKWERDMAVARLVRELTFLVLLSAYAISRFV